MVCGVAAVMYRLSVASAERWCAYVRTAQELSERELVAVQHLRGNAASTHWAAAPTILSYVAFHNKVRGRGLFASVPLHVGEASRCRAAAQVSWWVVQQILSNEKWEVNLSASASLSLR